MLKNLVKIVKTKMKVKSRKICQILGKINILQKLKIVGTSKKRNLKICGKIQYKLWKIENLGKNCEKL